MIVQVGTPSAQLGELGFSLKPPKALRKLSIKSVTTAVKKLQPLKAIAKSKPLKIVGAAVKTIGTKLLPAALPVAAAAAVVGAGVAIAKRKRARGNVPAPMPLPVNVPVAEAPILTTPPAAPIATPPIATPAIEVPAPAPVVSVAPSTPQVPYTIPAPVGSAAQAAESASGGGEPARPGAAFPTSAVLIVGAVGLGLFALSRMTGKGKR